MKKINEVITSSSTKEQRKQFLHLLINQITVGESRKIDIIKIQLNKEIINYLSIKEERLSVDDDPSSFYVIYIAV